MFNIDGKFFGVLSRLADLVILNLLFLVCCIPVVTVGAAVTAMYSVTWKMAEEKEGYILQGFFKAFKDNFKQSTAIWLILFVPFLVISVDLYLSNFMAEGIGQAMLKGFWMLALLIVLFVMVYALTLQCIFENTVKNTIKNAFLISLGHAPWSLAVTALALSPFISLLYFGEYFSAELLAMLLIWFSGAAYINSFILKKIYKKFM